MRVHECIAFSSRVRGHNIYICSIAACFVRQVLSVFLAILFSVVGVTALSVPMELGDEVTVYTAGGTSVIRFDSGSGGGSTPFSPYLQVNGVDLGAVWMGGRSLSSGDLVIDYDDANPSIEGVRVCLSKVSPHAISGCDATAIIPFGGAVDVSLGGQTIHLLIENYASANSVTLNINGKTYGPFVQGGSTFLSLFTADGSFDYAINLDDSQYFLFHLLVDGPGISLQDKGVSCATFATESSCLDQLACAWDQQTNSCIEYAPGMASCVDPDSGKQVYTQAHAFGYRSTYADERDKRVRTGGNDGCAGSFVEEYYCSAQYTLEKEQILCAGGCQDGICKRATDVFSDMRISYAPRQDGAQGLVATFSWKTTVPLRATFSYALASSMVFVPVQGTSEAMIHTVTIGSGSGVVSPQTNYVYRITALDAAGNFYEFPSVGFTSFQTPALSQCIDSDGGKNSGVFGTATEGAVVVSDYCSAEGKLVEAYCAPTVNRAGQYLLSQTITCPESCSNGVCVENRSVPQIIVVIGKDSPVSDVLLGIAISSELDARGFLPRAPNSIGVGIAQTDAEVQYSPTQKYIVVGSAQSNTFAAAMLQRTGKSDTASWQILDANTVQIAATDSIVAALTAWLSQLPQCVPDGGLDDTLGRLQCCSGNAVEGSTLCANPDDFYTTWESCAQICGVTGTTAKACPFGPTGSQWCPCPQGTSNNGKYGIGVCVGVAQSLEPSCELIRDMQVRGGEYVVSVGSQRHVIELESITDDGFVRLRVDGTVVGSIQLGESLEAFGALQIGLLDVVEQGAARLCLSPSAQKQFMYSIADSAHPAPTTETVSSKSVAGESIDASGEHHTQQTPTAQVEEDESTLLEKVLRWLEEVF